MVLLRYREIDFDFARIFRVYISGSSGSGKTHFAKQLIESSLFNIRRVHYFHPDFYESNPNDWQENISKDVIFQSQFPTRDDLLQLEENTCVVLDDLFDSCVNSKEIDELFRVISSKHKLHVIVMTQRYFYPGRFNLSIRNSCNYHVLMRNVDAGEVRRIGQTLGLLKDINFANKVNENKIYPYTFIDRSNAARANHIEVYTDIFSKRKEVVYNSMKYYLLTEPDFNSCFKKKDTNIAEHVNSKQNENFDPSKPKPNQSNKKQRFITKKQFARQQWRNKREINKTFRRALQQHQSRAKL